MNRASKPAGRLGILVGGGPAPGINGVIGSATIEACRRGFDVIGILDGFKWLARGDTAHIRSLTPEDVQDARFTGGSILGTSRENPTTAEACMAKVVESLAALRVTRLVTIGGDDTAFSGFKTAERAGGNIRVAHCPKTIDNDLPLPDDIPTFGFETARHVGAELVANLVRDAKTTRRWYVVVAMGRTAGHLALGMGVAGGAALSLIPEEFTAVPPSLDLICTIIEGAMIKAKAAGQDFGVAVIAEGIGELMKGELRKIPLVVVEEDEHTHLRLAEVPLALILKRLLQDRARQHGKKATLVDVTIGYELRCAMPTPFDVAYTHQLGWGATCALLSPELETASQGGVMVLVRGSRVESVPLRDLLDPRTGKMTVRRVSVDTDSYRAALAGMTRLTSDDLVEPRVVALAAAANLSVETFVELYGPAARIGMP